MKTHQMGSMLVTHWSRHKSDKLFFIFGFALFAVCSLLFCQHVLFKMLWLMFLIDVLNAFRGYNTRSSKTLQVVLLCLTGAQHFLIAHAGLSSRSLSGIWAKRIK